MLCGAAILASASAAISFLPWLSCIIRQILICWKALELSHVRARYTHARAHSNTHTKHYHIFGKIICYAYNNHGWKVIKSFWLGKFTGIFPPDPISISLSTVFSSLDSIFMRAFYTAADEANVDICIWLDLKIKFLRLHNSAIQRSVCVLHVTLFIQYSAIFERKMLFSLNIEQFQN